jgi:hypothetical protein
MEHIETKDGKKWFWAACLADLAGNYTTAGYWADLFLPFENNIDFKITVIVGENWKNRFKTTEKINDLLKSTVEQSEFLITLGGGWICYDESDKMEDLVKTTDWHFQNDRKLFDMLLSEQAPENIVKYLIEKY